MSNDEALIRLFSQPGSTDIYKQMAAVISLKDPDDVSDEERAVSKQVTLAIMYGMGLNTVAKKLGVKKDAAKAFFESFYGRFRGVKQWMDRTIAKARREKYVTTITGRRRYVQPFYLCGNQSFNLF
jgi:DNA polymerase I - 3''-5'' exonuclease and polymerase domains